MIPSGARVFLRAGAVDFRNYAARGIMRSLVGLAEAWIGAFGCSTPHNFGSSPAAEHGQELVRWSEPSGSEV
jgi:hypothetical protein